jgi:hypothetical protein
MIKLVLSVFGILLMTIVGYSYYTPEPRVMVCEGDTTYSITNGRKEKEPLYDFCANTVFKLYN